MSLNCAGGFKVADEPFNPNQVVPNPTKRQIAIAAQEATHNTCLVTVVNVKSFVMDSADCAKANLSLIQKGIPLNRKAILLLQIISPSLGLSPAFSRIVSEALRLLGCSAAVALPASSVSIASALPELFNGERAVARGTCFNIKSHFASLYLRIGQRPARVDSTGGPRHFTMGVA